jgi:hypothetical protein
MPNAGDLAVAVDGGDGRVPGEADLGVVLGAPGMIREAREWWCRLEVVPFRV